MLIRPRNVLAALVQWIDADLARGGAAAMRDLLKALSWTGLIWGLKPVPASVLAEAERLEHYQSVAATAAIAVATANAAPPIRPIQAEGPAVHRDAGRVVEPAGNRQAP